MRPRALHEMLSAIRLAPTAGYVNQETRGGRGPARRPLPYSWVVLGGCWDLKLAEKLCYVHAAEALPGGGNLVQCEVPTRCVGAYVLSARGAQLLFQSFGPGGIAHLGLSFDKHLDYFYRLSARQANGQAANPGENATRLARLHTAFVEPPAVCQAIGKVPPRKCFAPSACGASLEAIRRPLRLAVSSPRNPFEVGVAGCAQNVTPWRV